MTQPCRVLIVEDDPLIAMDLEDELADRGYEVISAATVADAIRAIEAERLIPFAPVDRHVDATECLIVV